jgi:hypothetical protein
MLIQRHRVKPSIVEQIEPLQEEEVKEVIDYEAMTKSEIIGALKKADIEFDGRQKKEELIEMLKASK